MHAPDIELQHGQGDRHKHERNGDGKTFGTRVEKSFAEVEQGTHDRAERQRKDDFEQRFDEYGKDVYAPCADGLERRKEFRLYKRGKALVAFRYAKWGDQRGKRR